MEHNPRKQEPEIGLVIPCYNEESVLPMLLKRLEGLLAAWSYPAWVLFVDDGSQDRTAELLAEACQRNERMACLKLSPEFWSPDGRERRTDARTGGMWWWCLMPIFRILRKSCHRCWPSGVRDTTWFTG